MSWSDSLRPVPMRRIALIAPTDSLRATMIRVAESGVLHLDEDGGPEGAPAGARLSAAGPDTAAWERDGHTDLLAGENELNRRLEATVRHRDVSALAGWCPEPEVASLRLHVEPGGAAVAVLRPPVGIDPPTLLGDDSTVRRAFAPLVRLYGVMPYRDVDPAAAAGLAYVAMFGMMFGDAGHGLLLIVAGMVLRSGWIRRLDGLRRLWVFVAGAGVAATIFGLLYGEFFGPTGVLPMLWLDPLADPVRLLVVAVAIGAVLLALAYGLGTVNRLREGGIRAALYASSGIAGATVFLGLGVLTAGYLVHLIAVLVAGGLIVGIGLGLSAIGMFAESGGGAAGVSGSGIGLLDLVTHIGANLVSFARLAAFGITHAALGMLVWDATVGAVHRGVAGLAVAAIIFLVGNAVAFALEALVAGVQALRLEFYEMFSRIFVTAGRPYTPWRIPVLESQEAPS
jgi:V/A-type H+/Na+-transporting ATPase subunit I